MSPSTLRIANVSLSRIHPNSHDGFSLTGRLRPQQSTGFQPVVIELYEDWPEFVYERSSFLNGQKRSVTPKAPHSGAQYLLIDDRPPEEPMSGLLGFPGTYPVGCCIPDETLRNHTHLASELFSLFIFRSGRPFEDKYSAAKNKDWSQVVWDLLETGMKKLFNRKNWGGVAFLAVVAIRFK